MSRYCGVSVATFTAETTILIVPGALPWSNRCVIYCASSPSKQGRPFSHSSKCFRACRRFRIVFSAKDFSIRSAVGCPGINSTVVLVEGAIAVDRTCCPVFYLPCESLFSFGFETPTIPNLVKKYGIRLNWISHCSSSHIAQSYSKMLESDSISAIGESPILTSLVT